MIDRSFVIAQVLGAIGMVAIGLGIAGLTGSGASVHPALGEPNVAWGCIAGGGVLAIVEARIIVPILLRRVRDQKDRDPR